MRKPKSLNRREGKKAKIHLENVNIREVLDEIGIGYSEEGKNVANGWVGVSCPWCFDESNHLGVCLTSPVISCWKCGRTGNYISYLKEVLGSLGKALDVLSANTPRELQSFNEEERNKVLKVELPAGASRKISEYHAGYLESRGFDYKALTDKYNFHYVGPIGEFSNHIIVPVVKNYRMITFTSVDISDNANIRYRHLADEKSIIGIKDYLFGLEFTDGHSVCVVEGFFDKLRIGDGCVASFGTKVTSRQKALLAKFNKVYTCFDGDKAGYEGAEKLANELAPFTDVEILDLPEGKDPDTLDPEDIEYIRRKIGK